MLFINKIKNRLSINKLTKLEQLTLKKLVLLVGKFKEYDEQKGIILIECLLRTPKNNIEKFLITKTILENESLEAVSLVKHSYLKSNKAYHIFRQLGVKRFYSIESAFLNLFILVRSFIKSCAFFISTKDGSDIVNYKINDILIGDLLYDSIIRENDKVFTVGNLKPFRDFTLVFKMFIYFFYYNSLTDRLNIKYYITSHKTYLQYGILCKLVKSKGGVVILKDVNLLKIYDKDPIEAHIMAPDYHLVKSNLNNVEFRNSAEKYIIDRFNANAENMDIDVISAFKNKNNYSKEDLLRVFELNSDSKFVFVMPHAFSDSPHVGTGMLFNDYFEWLVETLKAISKNDNYHIFIKPHPTSYCWGETGVVEELVKTMCLDKVHIVPNDLNTNCIPKIADVVVTCQGTIALECACFGTPSIVAGHGYFHGYNLSNYFNTKDEYLEFLSTFDEIKVLDDRCKMLAKVILYTEVNARVYSSSVPLEDILPVDDYYQEEINLWKKINELLGSYNYASDPLLNKISNYLIEKKV